MRLVVLTFRKSAATISASHPWGRVGTSQAQQLMSARGGSGSKRMRGRPLARQRAQFFSKNPLCVACLAKTPPIIRAAEELDHIVALCNGGSDDGPKQGLCKECHDIKTAHDMGYAPRVAIGLDGWPKQSAGGGETPGGVQKVFGQQSRKPPPPDHSHKSVISRAQKSTPGPGRAESRQSGAPFQWAAFKSEQK